VDKAHLQTDEKKKKAQGVPALWPTTGTEKQSPSHEKVGVLPRGAAKGAGVVRQGRGEKKEEKVGATQQHNRVGPARDGDGDDRRVTESYE